MRPVQLGHESKSLARDSMECRLPNEEATNDSLRWGYSLIEGSRREEVAGTWSLPAQVRHSFPVVDREQV